MDPPGTTAPDDRADTQLPSKIVMDVFVSISSGCSFCDAQAPDGKYLPNVANIRTLLMLGSLDSGYISQGLPQVPHEGPAGERHDKDISIAILQPKSRNRVRRNPCRPLKGLLCLRHSFIGAQRSQSFSMEKRNKLKACATLLKRC